MQSLVFHFVGGDALFTGVLVTLAGCLSALRRSKHWQFAVARAVALAGIVVAAASAVPLPETVYAIWVISAVTCLLIAGRKSEGSIRVRMVVSAAVLVCSIAVVWWELAWRNRQQVAAQPARVLYVIGDSLSAANDAEQQTAWPTRLHTNHRINVINLAQVGATLRSARQQAIKVDRVNSLVLIEIGGNDLLGNTTVAAFRGDLDTLLTKLKQPGRQLVMLELPLPPLYNGYGRAQRELSAKHGVVLIPRRQLAGVVFANGSTVDRLHLSKTGHRRMADMVWSHVSGSLTRKAESIDHTTESD